MLRSETDENLISEYRDVVADEGAKRAFDVLLEWARSSKSLEKSQKVIMPGVGSHPETQKPRATDAI
jgi:imidazoleglycerol phosphate synthase glutamine amidotransferase subunit HisH